MRFFHDLLVNSVLYWKQTLQLAHTITRDISSVIKQQSKVLIVEDEALFARAVMRRLQKAGYECEHVESLAAASAVLRQFLPDLVLLDMRLPDGNGLDLLADFIAKNAAVIVMTAYGEMSDAVNAIKQGAVDYLKKPIDLEELLLAVQKAEAATQQINRLDYSRQRNMHAVDGVELLGDSFAIQQIKVQIERISKLASKDAVPPTVLIGGETGTGKDVAARLLHAACINKDKPFVHVDCASLPAELMESELFGYEKGAFTGAQTTRPGLIEAAEDGTLFLDEIGELPLALQAKLLNVLERRVVRRLGSTKERAAPARFVAATNRNLHEMSQTGQFRLDLYYRLNMMSLHMPPLRDREDDAVLLARHFAMQTARRYGLGNPFFSVDAIERIKRYAWPGNVRELRHQVSRAMLLSNEGRISAADLALPMANNELSTNENFAAQDFTPPNFNKQITLNEAEKNMLLNALAEADNNVSRAARKLGITRMTMRYRMDKHKISV